MYLGIDIGTSSVKSVLVDDAQALVDQQTQLLELQTPHALWAEQDPEAWWTATLTRMPMGTMKSTSRTSRPGW